MFAFSPIDLQPRRGTTTAGFSLRFPDTHKKNRGGGTPTKSQRFLIYSLSCSDILTEAFREILHWILFFFSFHALLSCFLCSICCNWPSTEQMSLFSIELSLHFPFVVVQLSSLFSFDIREDETSHIPCRGIKTNFRLKGDWTLFVEVSQISSEIIDIYERVGTDTSVYGNAITIVRYCSCDKIDFLFLRFSCSFCEDECELLKIESGLFLFQ